MEKVPEQAINYGLTARVVKYRDATPLRSEMPHHCRQECSNMANVTHTKHAQPARRTKATTIQEASTCCYRLPDLHACATEFTKRWVCMSA